LLSDPAIANWTDPTKADGIAYDASGNPTTYTILRAHPGDYQSMLPPAVLPASHVIHWFTTIRAGQKRGAPEITPAVPLYAELRRYSLAVLAAAETAADFAAVLRTDHPAGQEAAEVDGDKVIEIERRKIWVAPEGWGIEQIKAEQPTTTYGDFKRELLSEASRALNLPYNVAAGDSSRHNYASGQLDYQPYLKKLRRERAGEIEPQILSKILREWIREAALIGIIAPKFARQILDTNNIGNTVLVKWLWEDSIGDHQDPVKAANADDIRLKNRTLTLAEYWARRQQNWEDVLDQVALENDRKKELGITDEDEAGDKKTDGQDDDDK
jgi:capsid protein